jgi:hypothetical protein
MIKDKVGGGFWHLDLKQYISFHTINPKKIVRYNSWLQCFPKTKEPTFEFQFLQEQN